MASSWCQHLDELVNGSQVLPPGTEFFGQVIEKTTLFKHIGFH